MHPDTKCMRDRLALSVPSHMSARNLRLLFVGAGYRVFLAATDSNQVHAGDTSSKFFDMSYVHNNAAMNPYKFKRTRFLMEFLESLSTKST